MLEDRYLEDNHLVGEEREAAVKTYIKLGNVYVFHIYYHGNMNVA